MRFKYLKYLAFVLGGLSTVVAAGALYLYATFDGVRLAAELTYFAKQRYQRSLRMDGPVELSMFPRLRLKLPATTLSGRNGGSEFIGIEQAVVSVSLLPLLTRRVVVERIEVDGLRMALQRDKAGKLNAEDLLDPGNEAAPASAVTPFELDVGALMVRRGALTWADEQSGRQLALSGLGLETGRIGRNADGHLHATTRLTRAEPATDVSIELESAYRLDAGDSLPRLRQLRLVARGDVGGWEALDSELSVTEMEWADGSPSVIQGCSLQVRGKAAGEPFELKASTPRLKLGPRGPDTDSVDASLRLDGKLRGGNVRLRLTELQAGDKGLQVSKLMTELDLRLASGRLTGTLAGPGRWQGNSGQLDLAALTGELNFAPTRAGLPPLKFSTEADARIDLTRSSAAGHLALRSAQSQIKGSWTLPRFDGAALGFDMDVNQLDVDAYLAGKPGRTPAPDKAVDERFDLSPLRGLEMDGVIRFGQLRVAGLKLEHVKLPLSVHGGRLQSAGHTLSLYGGSLEGSLSLNAEDAQASYRAYLQNAELGPLLKDFGVQQKLGGTTNFFVDLSSKAESRSGLVNALQGLARVRIRNGSVPGIDMGQAMKEWRGLLSTRQGARRPHRARESTPVGELTASFLIADGVARSADLKAKNGMLQVGGAGEIDLSRSHIDALSRVTLVLVPPGPDSGPLSSLRGMTLPVRVKGPLSGPDWHLEPGASLSSVVLGSGQAAAGNPPKVIPKRAVRAVSKVVKQAGPAAEKAGEAPVTE